MDPILPQPQEQLPASEPKHFLNKKFIVTFVILALLGSGAYASIWYWQNQQLASEVVPTFTPRPTDETANWKTYMNAKYGFEIKYPADDHFYSNYLETSENQVFQFNGVPGGGDPANPDTPALYFSIYAKPLRNTDEVSLCHEAGGGYIRQYYKNEKIKIAGEDHIKCVFDRDLQKDKALFISLNKNGYTWQFMAVHYDKYSEIIENVLSTFKFTK